MAAKCARSLSSATFSRKPDSVSNSSSMIRRTAGGWSDSARRFTDDPETYTYWDYYRQRFERNRGLRIDFVLGTPSFAERVTGAFIDRDERDPAQGSGPPSDHAPVVVDVV